MAIKCKCPKCEKAYSLKDELAGKKAKCAACGAIMPIPAPTAAPAPAPAPAAAPPPEPPPDFEAMAAAALADEPKPVEPPKDTRTINFNCPQCDEPLKLSYDLGGKQTQCPECRKIIKVPKPVEEKPKDWRQPQKSSLPSGAKENMPVDTNDAWTGKSKEVGKGALEAAGVLPKEKVRWTAGQWVSRVGGGVAAVAVVGVGTWLLLGYMAANQQRKMLDAARAAAAKLPPESGAEVHRALAEYGLRSNTQDGFKVAREDLERARALAANAPPSRDREIVLARLALTQVDLGGEKDQSVGGTRLLWGEPVLRELQQTLGNLPSREAPPAPKEIGAPGMRLVALRDVCEKLIKKGQLPLALGLARQAVDPGDEARPEALAQVALLLLRLDPERYKEHVETLANQALQAIPPPPQPPNPQAKRPPLPPSVVALCMLLNKGHPSIPPIDQRNPADEQALVGYAAGLVYQGRPGPANKLIEEAPLGVRLQALVAMAQAEKEDPSPEVQKAADLIEREMRGRPLPTVVLVELTRQALRCGQAERIQALAKNVPDRGLRSQMLLEVAYGTLGKADTGKVTTDLADGMEKSAAAYGLALEAVARHNARLDGNYGQTVATWDEAVQPLGHAGVALGLQDAAKK